MKLHWNQSSLFTDHTISLMLCWLGCECTGHKCEGHYLKVWSDGGNMSVCCTYEWSPWTPPSTCADMVLFSNFSSPEYIMELRGSRHIANVTHTNEHQYYKHTHTLSLSFLTGGQTDSLPRCPGSHVGYQLSGKVQTCGWSPYPAPSLTHPGLPSPCHPHCGQTINIPHNHRILHFKQKKSFCYFLSPIYLK